MKNFRDPIESQQQDQELHSEINHVSHRRHGLPTARTPYGVIVSAFSFLKRHGRLPPSLPS